MLNKTRYISDIPDSCEVSHLIIYRTDSPEEGEIIHKANEAFLENDLVISDELMIAVPKSDDMLMPLSGWRRGKVPGAQPDPPSSWSIIIRINEEEYKNAKRNYVWYRMSIKDRNRRKANYYKFITIGITSIGLIITYVGLIHDTIF